MVGSSLKSGIVTPNIGRCSGDNRLIQNAINPDGRIDNQVGYSYNWQWSIIWFPAANAKRATLDGI